MKILFILQNAYYINGYRPHDLKEWDKLLWLSHTGHRLRTMIPEGATAYVINASLSVGDCSAACFPADVKHLRKEIRKHKPDVICACGKIAQQGCDALGVSYVPAPHPAWRAFSREHALRIKAQLGE